MMNCIASIFFLLIGSYFGLAAELVSSNQFGDLRLQYLPPDNDGGEQITKYKIEWDASNDNASLPSFTPTSQYFGSSEVANVREEQDIIVSCRNACSGTFLLSWGGRVADTPLNVDATSDEVETQLIKLLEPFNLHSDGSSPVRVTRKANGFAFKWRVSFLGISGDIGLIQANGDLLVGSGANVRVVEVRQGSSDLYPGAYTNEIQTVSIHKRDGFGCESLSGNFALSFEGKVTSSIDVDTTAVDFKDILESLDTIHTVNVQTDHHNSVGIGDCSSRSWIVTFTHLVHENRQGAGDIGLLRLSSSSLSDPTVTQVNIFENVKGTNPRAFNIRGLQHGLTYHCRVSAYNSLGYGVSSTTVTATPKIQPLPPTDPIVSIPSENNLGTSLSVSWQAVSEENNGGSPVSDYKLDWYSTNDPTLEVQKLTTSAADGITEVQSIKISADSDGITGFFTLTFDGETTELIAHDAEADGEDSIEMKLERLSTIGDVDVSREYSWTSIPDVEFDLTSGSNVLSWVGGSYVGNLNEVFTVGDLIRFGEEIHTISTVGTTYLMTADDYSGPSATEVYIHRWSFGYEWLVTFTSHIGKQPLLEASPANNWAGTNPIIEVSRVREGLQPLSGTFRLGFEGERTLHIPFDADAPLVKQALESLSSIGEVEVARYRNNNGHNWFITFISELGNRELITVDDSLLMGPDARAKVATIIDGTEPEDYGSALVQHQSQLNPTSMQYQINGLDNGIPYYVRIRSRNDRGFGYAALASLSPMTPVKRPSSPTSVSMFPLSDTAIRVSWQASLDNGGSLITKYAVQMDVDDSFPNAWNQGYFHEKIIDQQIVDDNGDDNAVYCITLVIDPSSSGMLRYGRVLAYNEYEWSDLSEATVLSTLVVNDKPGPVRDFNALPTSNIGMVLSWSHLIINDEESCDYAGDGGEPITHYVVEYDEENDFNSPAIAITVPSSDTELRIGGRDVLTGAESSALKASGVYYARITPFNSVGPGTTVTFHSSIGPLEDTLPSPPVVRNAIPASATSIQVEWDTPAFDGGSVIEEYMIEYDTDPSFQSMPKNITLPTISEVKALQVASNELELNVQTIQATVAVTNEVQSIKTSVDGVDEIQEITTTCDDVTAEVQMIMTTAVDTNEEQVVSLISDDIDEIQLVRLQGDNQVEIQSVQVSVPRVNEVQKFGIVISNINTDGDGIHSTACAGINVGDPCPDIENALAGSFTVSFDFDDCGNGGVNYCQLALSEYEPSWSGVSCSPGLVIDPYVGGDHCVSEPVTHSYSSSEGDAGTLQQVLNDLVDDNGISFMTSSNVVGKQQAVTVTRTGRIKTKGSCTLDSVGNDPATCTGEYELLYEIEFDAVHSSGDVPPITIVTSDFKLDTSSASYTTTMCPVAYFVDGCESSVGAALDANHGSFYNGEAGSVAIESTKGTQPTGMVTLDYECESIVTVLPNGSTMTVSSDGMSATFDNVGYVANMVVGQQIRFSADDGIDYYRKITSVDDTTDSVVFDVSAPVNDATYTDVEFGDYFSDWNLSDGISGVSSHCEGDRIHTTLPVDVTTSNLAMSETDWRGKIGALSVIDSSGITVSRNVVPDLTSDIGLVWDVTFNKQPGVVHEMICSTVSGTNTCSVNTLQESSIIDGEFKLQTTWPHEYMSETPQLYETGSIRWNSDAQSFKDELEAIIDVNGDKVFGMVDVVRTPYIPPSHSRWSGGYMWTITFLSRGGNIPSLTFDDSSLTGITNPFLEVSDEDSGTSDLYQGVRNSATFVADDPGLARDGNQVSGSFALSWLGNAYHDAIATTSNVFTVQAGGSSSDQYTALSADSFKALFEEHVLSNSVNQIDVVRSKQPTQWMGFTYTIIFRHEDVGGDVPSLTYMLDSPLEGSNSYVQVDEIIKGTELVGTFQLRYEGETTRPINHDATPQDVQEALNDLNTIAPSVVEVSGGGSPIRSGPSDGIGGMSTQVGGRIWYVTFASNVWQDPTVVHDSSFVPGNWVGSPVSVSDTWNSGFSKAWGKNVGNVPMISCLHSGLSTTNGALPDGGCSVSELVPGTDPLGGSFKICLDTESNSNNVISVEADACTDFIAHNALASADESGGDGSSVEEKLEELVNVGDVQVTRSEVNPRNGGYTWKVQFLYDVDGPCEQKDDVLSLCNSAGDVQKMCDNNGATPCDTSSLKGTCLRPGSCDKLTVFDATDVLIGEKLPGGNEKQVIYVKDVDYLGWEDGSIVDTSATFKEYKLYINGDVTSCIKHNALTGEVATSIQTVLDNSGVGGSVRVDRTRSEHLAENGFVYYLIFYDTAGDLPLITSSTNECGNDFESSQSVVVAALTDGELHPSTCEDCHDGIVQRGDFTTFEVSGESLIGTLDWNADPAIVKAHLEQSGDRVVDVTRSVLDKYGTIEWLVTFTKNVGTTPPGAGDVDVIDVVQDVDTAGRSANIVVNEVIKGSDGLSGTFDLDYQSSGGSRTFSFDEPSNRMERKLEEMSTIGSVFVTRDEVGVWDGTAVTSGTVGGYQWTIVYQKNQGSAEGLTWPPGSGIISPPSIDHTNLFGEDATVSTNIQSSGSAPLTGTFKLVINGESTSSIPYNVDANAMKYLINDLQSVGEVSVKSGIQTNHLISGITANVVTDGSVASLAGGGDLREHLAPGDMFRLGGSSSEIDGAEKVGSASLTPLSPVLSDVQLDTRAYINVDETVRIGADTYSVVKNGVEVQQIDVHRDSSIADGDFYQLKVVIEGVEETTFCLTFDASAADVESTLNSLTILDDDDVTVTKSDTTTGFTGDSHIYKVYFGNLGNVDEMIAETCITGIDAGVDSSNSGVNVSTLKQGGKTEHQRVTLASDAGSTSDTPAFRLTISDDNANSWNSPCFAWGTPSLDIASIIDADVFGGGDVTVLVSLTDNGSSVSELTIVTLYSDEEIIESDDGLYKINVEFEGVTKSTSCLSYGASALEVQQEIGSLFDYNQDGVIDSEDEDHVSVSRNGDGSSSSGFGYSYELVSNGSTTTIGASGVLGSSAPSFNIADIGSSGGCIDPPIDDGSPHFDVKVARRGVDEYIYDIFFTGSHWTNVPPIVVNTFGDGVCAATSSDIVNGMNRGIGVTTIVDGGGTVDSESDYYVLDRVVQGGLSGQYDIYVVPPVFIIHSDSSEVQQIMILDDDNTLIWGSGSPSYKLSYDGEYTNCIAHNALESEIENELNSLTSLCLGDDPCVTVTRSQDSVLAPNGHVYILYFDSSVVARQDVNELTVDANHLDCNAFDSAGGEQVVISTLLQGEGSAPYSSSQLPFGGNHRWLGDSASNLPIYRTSGMYWFVTFDQSLGSVDMSLDPLDLSTNAYSSLEPNARNGVNPDRVVIPNLSTGIQHYAQVYSRTSFGISSSSSTIAVATPSDKPEKLTNLVSKHALHKNEVQSIVIAATHQDEVQTVTTSAIAIPEVQEITLKGAADSDMSTYFFSLRQPEVQVVKWTSSSPVTAGSFFLKLSHVDRVNSNLSGSIVYKEMQTPCISFDATANEVKTSIETGALLNGLGVDSVKVTRSGNGSYGYSYEIQFVGGNVRGNAQELTSDITLSGLDSSGGNTCTAFESPTNDATLEIWTENESEALGTDTPRAEVVVDANIDIIDGEFQLSVTHFGNQQTTSCISWNSTAEEVKSVLENLTNVDSVRVDKTGDGSLPSDDDNLHISYVIYFDGNAMHTDGDDSSGFLPLQGSNFVVTNPSSCQPLQAYHNNVRYDVTDITDAFASVSILSKYDGEHTLPGEPTSSSSVQISNTLTSSLPMSIAEAQVTQSIETDDNSLVFTITYGDEDGDVPILVCNQSPSLTSLVGCETNTIMDGNELKGNFYLASSDPIPFDASPSEMASALGSVSGIGQVKVSRSYPDGQEGYTWTITFIEDHGDVPLLQASSSLTGKGATILVTEVIKGNELGGEFYLSFDSSQESTALQFDVDEASLGLALESLDGIGQIDVSANGQVDSELGRSFMVTFLESTLGDVPLLVVDSSQLTGLGAVVSVSEAVKGSLAAKDALTISFDLPRSVDPITEVAVELSTNSDFSGAKSIYQYFPEYSYQVIRVTAESGFFTFAYDGSQGSTIGAAASSEEMREALEGLDGIETVAVERVQVTGGYEWMISFHSYKGDIKPLTISTHRLLPEQSSSVEISTKDCDECMYVGGLSIDTAYYIRARSKNSRGWSEYTDNISDTPRAIPSAPTNVHVNAISGECLEVAFHPPVYGAPLTSYVVEWDYDDQFVNAQDDDTASCTSLRYGNCVISQIGGSPPLKYEICNLNESEEYYIRVAARNEVAVQVISTSGYPKDNTNWSGIHQMAPMNQVPDPPMSLHAVVLGKNGVQLSFDWPIRDGGKAITEFVVAYSTLEDFSLSNEEHITSSFPDLIPNSGDRFVFDFIPRDPTLETGATYFIKLTAVNDVGMGTSSAVVSVVTSGPSLPPSSAVLSTLEYSNLPIQEATVSWIAPDSSGGYPVNGYIVTWWSQDKLPEVQVVRLLYTTHLSQTTFSLSFSPSPTVKKETSALPWNSPADLVRREILNLGWDEGDDMMLISDVKVSRSTLSNGYQWTITFGDNPDRLFNDGDQVSLTASVMDNGDGLGSSTMTVSTLQDGRRSGGMNEVQYLQVSGTGTLPGHYRLKYEGSEWTTLIPIHANAEYVKNALEQLSSIGEVDVVLNDSVAGLVHQLEITFLSNVGNLDALVVDTTHLSDNADVVIVDGSNEIDSLLNTKSSSTVPGELPVHYGNSGLLDPSTDTYQITGLQTGTEYFVAVSAYNSVHGLSKRMLPSPVSITPPLQSPEVPQQVSLGVNTGISDSLIIDFDAPESNGGSDILFYRVELDPTPSFDNPIVQDFHCPASNKRTEWEIETSADGGGVINGGSFVLELEVGSFTALTDSIPYDAVALSSNETGISSELIPTFTLTSGSDAITTLPAVNIEDILFPGDRLRFSGQSTPYHYYEVESVTGTGAVLTETFSGDDGVQVSTTRHYGGRGSPLSSRIHCQYDESLCPVTAESKSGSLQGKLEDLSLAIQNGVFVDRDGPNNDNGFIWRVTFQDDVQTSGDYTLRVHSNSLTTYENNGSAHVSVSLLNSGRTYGTCTGPLVMPSLGGLVKGLQYHGRVSARNSEGYSLPVKASQSVAPMVIPSAPTSVTLDVISATELRVLFGSPSDNGGDSITQYLIEWSTSSDFDVVQSSTLEYLQGGSPFIKNIEGLDTGTYYYVRVRAKNSQGYGISQMSTPASMNPHQNPSPPTNVKQGITSNTMLTVGWEAPLSDGGDSISKYRIEWDTKASFASSSYPPHKGYVDVGPTVTSHTIQLLSSQKTYFVRVFAMNTSGSSSGQLATPSKLTPSMQVPGSPHSLQAEPGNSVGSIEVSWQRPRIPNHSISCFNDGPIINDCPTPYGGGLPASDGGEDIVEYELEWSHLADFSGSDGGRKTYTGNHAVITHLYSDRTYFVRVLARNSVGSGKYSDVVSANAT